jgi:hypothetical protein
MIAAGSDAPLSYGRDAEKHDVNLFFAYSFQLADINRIPGITCPNGYGKLDLYSSAKNQRSPS